MQVEYSEFELLIASLGAGIALQGAYRVSVLMRCLCQVSIKGFQARSLRAASFRIRIPR